MQQRKKGVCVSVSSLDTLFVNGFDANNPNRNLPNAYLTIIFFNERFEYLSENSISVRV
jgi:hypothetical protein